MMLGFKKEYVTHESMEYTNQMLNVTENPQYYEQTDIDSAIMDLGTLTNHGGAWGVMNLSRLGESYIKDIQENPTLENIMKTVASFQGESFEDDEEMKEIQEVVQDIIKEDLNIKNPMDMMMMGMKVMAAKDSNKELEEVSNKIMRRIEKIYKNKMKPVLRQLAKEQGQLIMMEGIRYMKEMIYLMWIIFSLAQCSGVAVENPVLERQNNIRYYLNVLGMGQLAYWSGNFVFDLICYYIQAAIMIGLVYPLKLMAFQKQIHQMS